MLFLAMAFPGVPWWWPMMAEASASTAEFDPFGPLWKILPWVSSFVGLVLAAVFKYQHHQAKRQHITVGEPVPRVPVTNHNPPYPSWDQHEAVEKRLKHLELRFETHQRDQSQQYVTILETGQERERRIFDKIDEMAKGIYERIHDVAKEIRNTKTAK